MVFLQTLIDVPSFFQHISHGGPQFGFYKNVSLFYQRDQVGMKSKLTLFELFLIYSSYFTFEVGRGFFIFMYLIRYV